LKRGLAIPLLVLAGGLGLPHVVRAEKCIGGLEVRVSAPDTPEEVQGMLLLVEVRSEKPMTQITAKWNDREVPFWKEPVSDKDKSADAVDVRRALLGIDLEKPAGKYPFGVETQVADGQRLTCTETMVVEEGHFATENLTVKKQFVEPNPEQEARAKAEQQRLREIYDTVTPERLWDGPFRMPLVGDFKGSNFGKRRVLNGHPGSPHGGTDFPAPTGTPVHAAQRGKVVLAEELFFSGNTVVIDHGLGIYTFYCHFSEIDAKVGEMVDAGTVIGKVGATGRVTGPHLHWALEVQRARVSALDIVKLLGSGSNHAASGR
jgi:murein DD-endopeptidase MepM/ murein hydrolase activator NlpD